MQQKRTPQWPHYFILGLALLVSAATPLRAADDSAVAGKSRSKPNRLAKETSPYLLLHANNPVDWYPWGPEAFEKAKKEGKLIFLSIGYSSCYWCHVMERKVFSNEAIAKAMNQDFVCIKVDREERPEIDDIYMTALQVYYQAIGSPSVGGWPLSIFLTPDGKPVAGDTYFPPEDAEGVTGFPTVLARLQDLWKNKHDQVLANADLLAKETKRVMKPAISPKTVEINDALIEQVFASLVGSFDSTFGGIDFNIKQPNAAKFPTPVKLAFLQQQLEQIPQDEISGLLDLTLTQMACGGLRDHVGGGFHRYSVDRQWNVPHFEKMLYDQAQLANLYTEAYRTTKNPLYKQVAEEIFQFVDRELTSPDGGFYSALDAETNGVEGEFYVWEASEVDEILGADSRKFKEAYRIKELSDFEHGNVLRLNPKRLPKTGVPATAEALPGSESDEFAAAKQKLLQARNQRKKPLRDDKILTAWNGLMICAYAHAATELKHPQYARTAENAANFILTKLRDPQGKLLHCSAKGQSRFNAYLDDYAYTISGLIALHEATKDVKWLKAARQLQDDQLRNFLDSENGGFFFTPHQHEALLARTKNCYDGVLPAANSVSARNMIKMARLSGATGDLDEARALLDLFAPQLETSPRAYASFAMACTELLDAEGGDKKETTKAQANPKEIIQVANADGPAAKGEPLVVLAEQNAPKKDQVVIGKAYLSTDKLPAGGECEFVVLLDIKEKWHIQANPAINEDLIATVVTFKSDLKVELDDLEYPKPLKIKSLGDDLWVYEGKDVAIRGTLIVPESAAGKTDNLEFSIRYQPCDEKGCRAPVTIKLNGKLVVAKKGEQVKQINARLFPAQEAPKK